MMDRIYENRVCRIIGSLVIAAILVIPSVVHSADLTAVREHIESFLLDNYPWDDIEVSSVRVTGRVRNDQPAEIRVEKGPLGHAAFSFRYSDGARRIVRAKVTAYAKIVKSRRPFRKDHVLAQGDIYEDRVDVRKMPGSAIQDMNRIIGKALRRSISANVPLREDMVETSLVVRRGSRVLLLLDEDGIRITAVGRIKEKGRVGHAVKAVNLSSNKEVVGVLIDESTVKVEM
jgi:flagella basal body P-ring formation protein FlgA